MQVQLIAEWKHFYKLYSIWFFAIIFLMPDLYNLAIQNHLFEGDHAPALFSRLINLVAFAGAAMRLVQQKVVTDQAAEKTQESDAAPPAPPASS